AHAVDAPRFDETGHHYDAILVQSFGGPEGPDDVMPFLENVTRGRNIPPTRLAEVAEHYLHFGGVSPLNGQNRALIAALERELSDHGIDLPIYFGNRNWRPFLTDAIGDMHAAGVRRALVFVTSGFSSYSGCRQYREDIERAMSELGLTDDDIAFDKIRVFYNHPGFVAAMADRLRDALATFPAIDRAAVETIFTAHSIPQSMARGSAYVAQLRESCRLVAEAAGVAHWRLAFQSRSGPPQVPWLEPDILDALDAVAAAGAENVAVVPIGFISDHMEVLFDLDEEAAARAAALGMTLARAGTAGTHPAFVAMIRELIEERMTDRPIRRALGGRGPSHDICPLNCCLIGATRPVPSAAAV
ncbi:MAG TPA: ferrochelatase, partial [Thermomicrobiales bacterium]|nr:ferrochelatase [Thermomicrobiales bacterium]